ncbi:hypothetical protein WJX84_008985 [Apatococcus fuscideae]|uniref:S5 DRBM domain-containing protein n=1 Tax=Apatococcus fuscideae TaxID=2026836 RepID=A0AAW1SU49_9CHLO
MQAGALATSQPNSCRSARVQTRWICKAETEAAEAEDDEDEDIDPEDIAGVDGLDEDVEDIPEDSVGDRRDGRQLNAESSYDSERRDSRKSKYEERVIEVSRVTKVVKGGKQLGFRCVLAMGDEKGTVGVGCASAKEEAYFGAAKVMLRPASDGTGLIAGGSVRTVLELAGIQNGFGKQIGSPNPLNNARCTIECLSQMRSMQEIADTRGMTIKEMLTYQGERAVPSAQPV